MTVLRARLEPIDPLLFGDNRSARAGELHALADQDPTPITLYGAIGARIAACFGVTGRQDWNRVRPVLGEHEPRLDRPSTDRAELLGYTLAGEDGRLWFPKPLHLRVRLDGTKRSTLAPLRPVEEKALLSSLGDARRLSAEEVSPEPGELEEEDDADLLVNETLLEDVLTGGPAAGRLVTEYVRTREDLFRPETRLGLAMDNRSNTTQEGRLFARPYRRFRGGIYGEAGEWRSAGFTAWYRLRSLDGHEPEEWNGTGFLGGDRRRTHIRFIREGAEAPLAGLRDRIAAAAAESAGPLLYLLTPAIADTGGPSFQGELPVAAAIGRPLTMSGWEALSDQPGPREARTLYPAGSVLFFLWGDKTGEEARRRWIADRWLAPLSETWRNAGFGRVLPGVWR